MRTEAVVYDDVIVYFLIAWRKLWEFTLSCAQRESIDNQVIIDRAERLL
jgi:hypothetical protein